MRLNYAVQILCNQLHSAVSGLEYQVSIFRMIGEIFGDGRTDHVNLQTLLAGPLQRGMRQIRTHPLAA
jgi:hypothetical protein